LVPTNVPSLTTIADLNGDGMDDLFGATRYAAVGTGLYAAVGPGAALSLQVRSIRTETPS
jgi:hypothetical protein